MGAPSRRPHTAEVLTDAARQALEGPLRPRKGARVRLFRAGWAEALTRSHPLALCVLAGPAFAWALEAARPLRLADLGPALAGALLWAALEYAMHRFFFHLPGDGERARGFRLLVHEHHHLTPDDPRRLAATPWQAALAMLALAAIVRPLFARWPVAFAGGLLAYLAYEAIHHRIHHGPRGGRLLRALRAHHLRHHAPGGEGHSFGISTPLFDWLLRSGRGRG